MEVGEQFGQYRLISRIGAGGMGEVWKAEDIDLRRTVAIKILPAANARDLESNKRFKREARTVAQLNHPNIATIFAIDQKDDRAFIVMEFIEGEPLSRLIQSRQLSESDVAFIGKGVAEALAEAHDKGIVHRDVKPDNVVVSGSRVKVLDFGIAKRYGQDAGPTDAAKSDTEFRTEAGMIIGTVQYMSPEQAMGKLLDGRSDIFSLGVVMYEALAGRLPFEGDSAALTLTRIIRDDPPNVRASRPGVSPKLTAIVMRCLEKDPARRYSTARDLADALGAIATSVPDVPSVPAGRDVENAINTMITTPKPVQQVTRKRTPRTEIERHPTKERSAVLPWIVAMVAVVITSVVGTAWYLTRGSKPVPANETLVSANEPMPPAGAEIAVTPSASDTSSTQVASATITELAPTDTTPNQPVATATQPVASSVSQARSAPPLTRAEARGELVEPPTSASSSVKADYYYRKGLLHLDRRQPLEAYESFKQVVTLDPSNAAGWIRAGELALFLKNPQEAMRDFKKAAQIGEGLDQRDALTAEFGRAIVDGDVAAMDEACRQAPFDRLYNELRRAAKKRGATSCPAPIGVGLEGGRGPAGRPGTGSAPALPPKPIRRP